jgi:steroid delta-isomerase-like uncharacterized protein
MSTEETRKMARRWMDEVWQKASSTATDEILAADFTFNYAAPGVKPDREGYKQTVKEWHTGFPDVKFATADVIALGDKAAVHWKCQGTHRGRFLRIAPTGKRVSMAGISIIRIAGGKIVDEVGYANMMEVMQELGAVPPSG